MPIIIGGKRFKELNHETKGLLHTEEGKVSVYFYFFKSLLNLFISGACTKYLKSQRPNVCTYAPVLNLEIENEIRGTYCIHISPALYFIVSRGSICVDCNSDTFSTLASTMGLMVKLKILFITIIIQ